MKCTSTAITGATLLLASMVEGHGFIKSPKARMPGNALKASCGETLYNNAKSDHYANVQSMEQQVKGQQNGYDAAKCNLNLCKGYKFADNQGNIQHYAPGQKIHMDYEIRAPHTGVANVSIVDTASNTVIGKPLISFDQYASTETGVQPGQTSFDFKMPQHLPKKCKKAGKCVIQHWWDSRQVDQTYESCIDFTWKGN